VCEGNAILAATLSKTRSHPHSSKIARNEQPFQVKKPFEWLPAMTATAKKMFVDNSS